jgi:hypothetical protein
MENKKINIPQIITFVLIIIMFVVCFIGGLQLHSKFVIGWDKDCRLQMQNLTSELDYPPECRDFSTYHMLLIFSIGLMFAGISALLIGQGMIITMESNNKNG